MTTPMTPDATMPDPKRWRALAVLGIAYLMVVLDVAVVNVALPSISEDLKFSTEGLQWVVSGYALTFGGLLLLGGRTGDLFGRRRIFMAGLALFTILSLVCGFAQSSSVLVVARMFQGAAGAILSPSVFSITTVIFSEGAERNKALGILGAIAGSGAAIGVLLGGVLTQYAGWEWIFFVNAPIGAVALILVPMVVRESRSSGDSRHLDALGAVTITGSLMLLVYGLTEAPNSGWGSASTIGILAAAAAVMAAFIVIEQRSPSPLVPLSIFKRRTITGANVIGLILGAAIFGTFFLQSLYMQQVLGFNAVRTGLAYLAIALTAVVAAGASQALVTRLSVRPVLTFGLLCLTGGLVYSTQISVNGSYFQDLFPAFMLVGVGIGFSFVPISIAALSGVTGREAGLASGLINTAQQVGGALGLAILITVATTRINSLFAEGAAAPDASVSGFRIAFWVAAGIAASGVVATLVLLRGKDLKVTAGTLAPAAAGH
jgi:EmrB/QacA subfamily drug resistance transporter